MPGRPARIRRSGTSCFASRPVTSLELALGPTPEVVHDFDVLLVDLVNKEFHFFMTHDLLTDAQ